MPSKKISQLPLGVPTGSDIFPFVQGGVTKKGLISSIPSSFIELTYADASTLITTSGLTKGGFYKITDRGDNGIILQAIDVDEFSPSGVRLMLCPNYEITGNMFGFWNGISGTTMFSAGDRVIWGGYYWENVSGGTGVSLNVVSLDSEWTLVPKSIANGYEEKEFDIQYDFVNDWIEKQYDGYGNIVGVPYNVASILYAFNPCDHSDWNILSNSFVGFFYNNNSASGFINNTMDDGNPIQTFFNNTSFFPDFSGGQELGITNNIFFGGNELLFSNQCEIISNNTSESIVFNKGFTIIKNDLNGSIEGNLVDNIYKNYIDGYIDDNIGTSIEYNTNQGYIYSNFVGEMMGNSNLGNIENNNLIGLNNVSVSGDCSNNTGGGRLNFILPFSGSCNGNVVSRNFGKTYYNFDFTSNPLISGTPQYFQSIPINSKVIGYYGQGDGLSSSTNSASIEIGPSIDDPSVINASIVTFNTGSSDTLLMSSSIKTTSSQLFEINAIAEDITGGTLSIWIDYVTQ